MENESGRVFRFEPRTETVYPKRTFYIQKDNKPQGREDVTEIMTDRQFDKIMKLVRMVLDGCKDLEEAKQKVDQLIEEQTNKKED